MSYKPLFRVIFFPFRQEYKQARDCITLILVQELNCRK